MHYSRKSSLIPELKKFIKQFSTLTDYSKAVALLLRGSIRLIDATSVILLRTNDAEKGLQFERAFGFPKKITNPTLSHNDSLLKLLQYRSAIFQIDKNEKYKDLLRLSIFMNQLPQSFSCQLVIKLTVNNVLYGALLYSDPIKANLNNPKVRYLLAELGERAGVTLRHARLLLSLRREALEKDLLLETGRNISSTLDQDELLDLILDQLRSVVHYDKGSIFLLDPRTKNIARVARRGPMPLFDQSNFLKKSEGLCTWVIKNAQPVVVDDVATDSRYYPIYLDTQSEMDVPILNRDRVLGLFNLESNRKNAFTKRDRRLVQALAGQAAIAIDNAWLYKQVLIKKELENELKIAKRFQRALLPRHIPQTDDFSFAALNIPSRTVGGDIYDFIQFSDRRIGITIGDVAGKGTPGAILMATLYSTYRGIIRKRMPINQMMYELNNILKGRISSSSFITFFYGELAPATGEFIYCNAGHFPPLLVHENGDVETLSNGGTVLGFISNTRYEIGRIFIKPNDLLFFYTDGITEASSPEDELYGEERLLAFLNMHQNMQPKQLLRQIFRVIRQFTGLNRTQDDFTAVAIKRTSHNKSGNDVDGGIASR